MERENERTRERGNERTRERPSFSPSLVPSFPLRCSAFICGFIFLYGGARADTVLLADGGSLSGRVRAGSAPGELALERGREALLPLKLEEMVAIDFGRSPVPQTITVTLTTGERLAGKVSFPGPDRVAVARPRGTVTLPLSLCASLRFSAPPPAGVTSDTLLLGNGDRIGGRLLGVRDGKALIQAPAGKLSVDLKRVAAITRRPATGETAKQGTGGAHASRGARETATEVLLELASGEQIAGRWERLDVPASAGASGETGEESTSGGVASGAVRVSSAWGGPLSIPLSSVSRLLVRNGRCVFLSDLRAVEVRQVAFLDSSDPYHVNQSAGGRPLQLGGERFSRGLGVRPRSELTYELAGAYKTFAATVGIDAEVGAAGSVVFRVLGDDRVLYESPVVRGGDEPRDIRVDTPGVLLLRLVVDFADNGDVGDHADWANARLLR